MVGKSHNGVFSRRRLLGFAAAIGVTPVLQACAGFTAEPKAPAEAPPPTTAPAGAQPATGATPATTDAAKTGQTTAPGKAAASIEVATRGAADGEFMEQSVVDFAGDTGIQARHVAYGPEPEYWARVQSMHATRQLADVVWASVGNLHNFANRGLLAELDPLIAADNYDMSDYVQNGLESCSLNGRLYAMPWGGHPSTNGLLYNKTLLDEAGIDPPDDTWNYDTLLEAARTLTQTSGDRTEVFGFAPSTGMGGLDSFAGGFGAQFMDPPYAGTRVTIDTPEMRQALTFVKDFFLTHRTAPTPGPDVNLDNLFASGRIALYQSWYGGAFAPGQTAIADRFEWGLDLMPTGPTGRRGSILTVNGQTISATSTKQPEGWQFLKWLMTPENHIPVVLVGGSRPALRDSVLNDPRLNEQIRGHRRMVQLIQQAEPWKMPANYRWPEFSTTLGQIFSGVWVGSQSLDDAIREGTTRLQAILDRPAID